MLYRPNYCANCGEKIERVDWGILTSRRFCGICETEYKGHELLIRGIVAVGLLAGVVGIGAYIRSGSTPVTVAKQSAKLADRPVKQEPEPTATAERRSPGAVNPPAVAGPPVQQMPGAKPPSARIELAEAQYYCGAETKKGTPCSRRVKGNARCYQHTGMPAMASPERLKIN